MPINIPQFPVQPVPQPRPAQPLQPPPFVDPAGIIMKAAELRQYRDLEQQKINQRQIEGLMNSIQTAQSLQERKREADMQNLIAQQGLAIQKGQLPVEAAHARLLNLQADLLSKGVGAPYYNTEQAASMIASPNAGSDELKTTGDTLNKLWPGGLIPKDFVHSQAMMTRFSENQELKQTQFQTKQWTDLNRKGNPGNASSRTPIGQAAINNMRADRALSVLRDPTVSDQQINQAVTDLAGIMHGGVPNEIDVKNQMYNTIQGKWNDLITSITATPQMAREPAIVAKLQKVVNEVKMIDNQYLDGHFKSLRNTYGDLYSSDPQRYENWEHVMRSTYMGVPQDMGVPQQRSWFNEGINTIMDAVGLSTPAVSNSISSGRIKVKHPNGQIGTIPSSQLQEAQSQGYQPL